MQEYDDSEPPTDKLTMLPALVDDGYLDDDGAAPGTVSHTTAFVSSRDNPSAMSASRGARLGCTASVGESDWFDPDAESYGRHSMPARD